MKVKDLNDLYNGKKIRLGAKDGNSFIWCGRVDECFLPDIERLSERHGLKLMKLLSTNKAKYVTHKTLLETCKDKDRSLLDRRVREDKERYEMYQKRVSDFTPILEREVVDIYPSIEYSDVTIIMYDGMESGSSWGEWEKKGAIK